MAVPTPTDAKFAQLLEPEVRTADDVTRLAAQLIRLCVRRGLPYDDCLGAAIAAAHEGRPVLSLRDKPAGTVFVRRFARGGQEMTLTRTHWTDSRPVAYARPTAGGREIAIHPDD